MKTPLTPEQRDRFTAQFNQIMERSPHELQAKWSGQIYWSDDIPLIDGNIHLELKGFLLNDYVDLKSKLHNRTL